MENDTTSNIVWYRFPSTDIELFQSGGNTVDTQGVYQGITLVNGANSEGAGNDKYTS